MKQKRIKKLRPRRRGWIARQRGGTCGLERLPSELQKERRWRTREDAFGEVWEQLR